MELSVLIIEDAEPMSLVLNHLFSELNFKNIYSATTGSDALEIALTKKPDLITIDTVLPDMTGIDVLKIIKSK